jgi:hypothetical protein
MANFPENDKIFLFEKKNTISIEIFFGGYSSRIIWELYREQDAKNYGISEFFSGKIGQEKTNIPILSRKKSTSYKNFVTKYRSVNTFWPFSVQIWSKK